MSSSVLVILIMFFTLILFVTEIVPISVTSMGTLILFYLIGVIDKETALKAFSSETVMIIASMSIIGEAIFETGGAHKLGQILTRLAKNERNLVFIIVIFSGIISGFLSNTGAAALLISFTLGICQTSKMNRTKLIYPVIVGCSLGGGLTIVGTTSGPFLKETYDSLNLGVTLSFFEFTILSLILIFSAALYLYLIGYNLLPDKPNNILNSITYIKKNKSSKLKMYLSFIIILLTLTGMVFEKNLNIDCSFIAIIGALTVIVTKCTSLEKSLKVIPINGIILYASMVPLGEALINSGAADKIVIFSLKILNKIENPFIIIILIFLIVTPITNFMSNAATIILFTPIIIIIGQGLKLDVKGLLIALRFAASIAVVTPIATPPNTMALEPGGYGFKDFIKVGFPLAILEAIICIIYIYYFYYR